MGYYDDEKSVEEYVRMAEGIDGRRFVSILKQHLNRNATILELGMGPEKDLKILTGHLTASTQTKCCTT